MNAIRVLIADRDEMLLYRYRRYLASHGVEVSLTTSGLDCIARMRDFRPDVLVVEPGLLWGAADGVLERMHTDRELPTVPAILLATASEADQLCRALEFPIDRFMVKPIGPEELFEEINRVRCTSGVIPRVELPYRRVAMQHTGQTAAFPYTVG